MATFLLGAGITQLVGSSGGTTFKRNKGANVWMNKSRGASRQRTLNNIRLANNAQIFRQWSTFSEEEKLAWNDTATTVKVKNKFGQDVNISGVALSRKAYLQGQVFSIDTIDPTLFTTDIRAFTLGDVTINWSSKDLKIFYNAPAGPVYVAVMLEYSQRPLNAPQFTRRGVVFIFPADGDSSFTFDLDTVPSLAFLNSNYNLRAYSYTCNLYGWISLQQFKNVILAS